MMMGSGLVLWGCRRVQREGHLAREESNAAAALCRDGGKGSAPWSVENGEKGWMVGRCTLDQPRQAVSSFGSSFCFHASPQPCVARFGGGSSSLKAPVPAAPSLDTGK